MSKRHFMVRRKRDLNQKAITDALDAVGVPYWDFSGVGGGCPDLLIRTKAGRLCFLEVKQGAGQLREKQIAAAKVWPVVVVRTVEQALAAVQG